MKTLLFFITHCFALELLNTQEIGRILSLEPFSLKRKYKVAVLDNGFGKKNFPESFKLIEFYDKDFLERNNLSPEVLGNPLSPSKHGEKMALSFWSFFKSSDLEVLLLNANGFTQFKRAVAYSIENNVDIILYSQTWDYGGNFDGLGFINREVNKALEKGIFWINAAGNNHGYVLQTTHDDFLDLPIRIESLLDDNPVRVTLAWSDFKEIEEYQTSIDYDLHVLNSNYETIFKAERQQVDNGEERGVKTLHAREKFLINLDRGSYFLKLIPISVPEKKKLRLELFPMKGSRGIEAFGSKRQEIAIPADNPSVLTVGMNAEFSSQGPTLDGRKKPDLILPKFQLNWSDGENTLGTSDAAALSVIKVLKFANDNNRMPKIKELNHNCKEWPYTDLFRATNKRLSLTYDKEKNIIYSSLFPTEFTPLYYNALNQARYYGVMPNFYRYFIARSDTSPYPFRSISIFLPQNNIQMPNYIYPWIEIKHNAQLANSCSNF